MKKETKHQFTTSEDRDNFLTNKFPERECTDYPGIYRVANGHIRVFFNEVTVIQEVSRA